MKLDFFAHSIQGRRGNNEDSCLAVKLNEDNVLLAVADGMGGAAAGEIASQIAIHTLHQFIQDRLEQININSDFKTILFQAFSKIQEAIRSEIEKNPGFKGMGTTLSVLWIYKIQYVWANLGDSRIYYLNEKIIKQITRDHTYIQDFADKHGIDAPPEMVAQYGNYILRTLDGGNDIPDIFPIDKDYELLDKSCAFLLCSDGLILNKADNLNRQLHSIFLHYNTLQQSSEALTKYAYDSGSTDNITVVLGEYGIDKRKVHITKPVKNYVLIALMAILVIVIGIVTFKADLFSFSYPLQKDKIQESKEFIPVVKIDPQNDTTNAYITADIADSTTFNHTSKTTDSVKIPKTSNPINNSNIPIVSGLTYEVFPIKPKALITYNLNHPEPLIINPITDKNFIIKKYKFCFWDSNQNIVEEKSIVNLPLMIDKKLNFQKDGEYTVSVTLISSKGMVHKCRNTQEIKIVGSEKNN